MRVERQTDPAAWNAALREAGGHPLQAWAWGELKQRFGWQAHRFATTDGRARAQLLIRPLRGIAAAYVPRGPQLSGDVSTDGTLLHALERFARQQRAVFLRLEPAGRSGTPDARRLTALLNERRYRQVERTLQPRSSVVLDIDRDDDTLRAGFSKGHRADVRRAERNGVTVREGKRDGDADLLHAMMQATQSRKNFGIHTPAYYRATWRLYGDDARLLLAELEGETVAAALVLAFGGQAIYLAAGSTRAGLDARAGHLVQWQAIRWARDHGAREYDMWGIPDARGRLEWVDDDASPGTAERAKLEQRAAADPLDGVFRFKKGWGGSVVRGLPAFDRVYFRPAYWFWLWRRSEA